MNKRIIEFKIVIRICSNVLLITGFGFFVSLVVAIIYKESVFPFVYSILLSVIPGLTLKLFSTRSKISDYKLNRRNAYFTVAFSWVLLGLIGCLPYVFSSSMTSFTDAIFESVSGLGPASDGARSRWKSPFTYDIPWSRTGATCKHNPK